jgi:hypothetical protein
VNGDAAAVRYLSATGAHDRALLFPARSTAVTQKVYVPFAAFAGTRQPT